MNSYPIDLQETRLVKMGFLKILGSIGYYAGCHDHGYDYGIGTSRIEDHLEWAKEFSDTWLQTDNNDFEIDVEAFTIKKMTRPYLVQLHKTITVRIEATSKDDALEKADNRYLSDDEDSWTHADTSAKVVS